MGKTRKRIGFLWPADGLNDAEFLAFVPTGVDWLVARYDAGTETEDLTPETLTAYAKPDVMTRAANILKAVSPDVVACGDHAASFISGQTGASMMAGAVEQVLGCPVVTMAGATIDALHVLDARKIAVVSPYSQEVSSALFDSLKAAGFVLTGHRVQGAVSEEDIGTRNAADWLPDLLSFVEDLPERPDAVFLAGGGVCFADAIERFEAETDLPIVTAPGALVRQAALLTGVAPERPGLGRLFRPKTRDTQEAIWKHQSSGTKSFVVSKAPPVFTSGTGPWLISEDGHAYLDFASGSGTTALGHRHPELQVALNVQSLSGVTHLGPHFHAPVQARVYELLSSILPAPLSRFHPAVSGSEATEVAMKAAMHATRARRFMGFEGGYHGRTFGALSVSGAKGKNQRLGPFTPEADILPFPVDAAIGSKVAEQIRSADQPLAGVIIEPLQATAGFRMADRDGLQAIAQAAQECDVPFIVDEVFTGFGRMGRRFSFEAFNVTPDLVILAKSFGGGMPAGLVAGTEEVLAKWPQGVQTSTFQLHPAAAATAEAFLNVFLRDDLAGRAQAMTPICEAAFAPCRAHPEVAALRGEGLSWALEMSGPDAALEVRQAALRAGLLTWECGLKGEAIGLVPPLVIDESHIALAGKRMLQSLETTLGSGTY